MQAIQIGPLPLTVQKTVERSRAVYMFHVKLHQREISCTATDHYGPLSTTLEHSSGLTVTTDRAVQAESLIPFIEGQQGQ